MSSATPIHVRRQGAALALAAMLLFAGLSAILVMSAHAPAAHADGPTITLSTSTTNPGGEVIITGSGWAPAKTYNLYVYSQRACNGAQTCPPPSTAKPITDQPQRFRSDGTFTFDFTFSSKAAPITYVFTVVADYPADNPYTASVPEQVVPAGTPPSGTPISSNPNPTATPTTKTNPTNTAASPTASQGSAAGNQTPTNTGSSGGSGTLIALNIVVFILLLLMIGVLVVLLRVLPPRRRAIQAQFSSAGRAASPGRPPSGARRQPSGSYTQYDAPEPPWQGGVAAWDDEPDLPRGSRSTPPRPPYRPGGGSGPRW